VGVGAGALPSEHASAGGCGQRGGRACARGTATGGAKEMHARPVVVVGRASTGRGQCVRCACACIIGWTVGSILLGLVPVQAPRLPG
jgi:hypothetical protein